MQTFYSKSKYVPTHYTVLPERGLYFIYLSSLSSVSELWFGKRLD